MAMAHEPNTQGPVVGKLYDQEFIGWYVNHLGEKWEYDRVAAVDAQGRADLSQLADDERLRAPGLIYKYRGQVAEALPEEHHPGHCSCGRAVLKILNSRRSKVAYVYPESQNDGSHIFSCQSCRKPISDSWQPDN